MPARVELGARAVEKKIVEEAKKLAQVSPPDLSSTGVDRMRSWMQITTDIWNLGVKLEKRHKVAPRTKAVA